MMIIINGLMNLEPGPILGLWTLSLNGEWLQRLRVQSSGQTNGRTDEQVQIHSPTQILKVGPKIMHKIWILKGRIMYVL